MSMILNLRHADHCKDYSKCICGVSDIVEEHRFLSNKYSNLVNDYVDLLTLLRRVLVETKGNYDKNWSEFNEPYWRDRERASLLLQEINKAVNK